MSRMRQLIETGALVGMLAVSGDAHDKHRSRPDDTHKVDKPGSLDEKEYILRNTLPKRQAPLKPSIKIEESPSQIKKSRTADDILGDMLKDRAEFDLEQAKRNEQEALNKEPVIESAEHSDHVGILKKQYAGCMDLQALYVDNPEIYNEFTLVEDDRDSKDDASVFWIYKKGNQRNQSITIIVENDGEFTINKEHVATVKDLKEKMLDFINKIKAPPSLK